MMQIAVSQPQWETQGQFLAPGLALAQCLMLEALGGGEYTDGRALALNLSLPLSLSLPFKIKSIILR